MLELNLTIMNETHDGGFDEIILKDIDNENTFYFIKDDVVYQSKKLKLPKEGCKINFYDGMKNAMKKNKKTDFDLVKILEAVYATNSVKRRQ